VVYLVRSVEQSGIVIEAFFKNAESMTATHRAFRTRLGLSLNKNVPDRKTILKWIENLRATGSTMLKKPAGRAKTVGTLENIAAVKASIEQSPSHSARKYAAVLRMSNRTTRQILHRDLKLHLYKITVT